MTRQSLEAAYRATAYVVALPGGPCTLRIGAPSAALDDWLAASGFERWSWLTAVNPGSQRLAPEENRARLDQLLGEIATLGFQPLAGTAIADAGDWPDEASCLVPGLDPAIAFDRARRHGQNAFLAGERAQPVRLIRVK